MPERDELLDALAYAKARENIEVIADELDLECRRTVSRLELRHLARDNGPDWRSQRPTPGTWRTPAAREATLH